MKNINFQELNDFYDEFCEVSGVKNGQRNNRKKHFNLFIAECKFKPTDNIERLVEKEIYLLECHKGTANKRYVKELVNKDFIEFLKKNKINTLPLLPTHLFVKEVKSKSFKFGKRHREALHKFSTEINQDDDIQLLKLIILNIFYRIDCKQIATDIKPSSIKTESKRGDGRVNIYIEVKSQTDSRKIYITEYARDILLQDCKEDETLTNKSLSPFMDRKFPQIIKSYGFLDNQDFKDTVFQLLVNEVGINKANAAIGFTTIKHAKGRYEENLQEGSMFIIKQYFAIDPSIRT